jgi:hypothetical protein
MCSKHGPIDWYHFLNNVSCHIFFALYIFCGWHDRIFQNIFPFLPGFNFRQYLCSPFSYKCKKGSFNGSIDYSNKHCELGGGGGGGWKPLRQFRTWFRDIQVWMITRIFPLAVILCPPLLSINGRHVWTWETC